MLVGAVSWPYELCTKKKNFSHDAAVTRTSAASAGVAVAGRCENKNIASGPPLSTFHPERNPVLIAVLPVLGLYVSDGVDLILTVVEEELVGRGLCLSSQQGHQALAVHDAVAWQRHVQQVSDGGGDVHLTDRFVDDLACGQYQAPGKLPLETLEIWFRKKDVYFKCGGIH
ncbi:hypothetical protein C0Q70_15012 [Pomacea canaliculata]|uniref:Uncharacterized protein n=1 Tax=Pomacea canaliculata TaxID=400727 RepID=A0A2T7NTN5_POMCA|nr:hypothetical protein C0Q70_15012 [Pomacea canaliculata]